MATTQVCSIGQKDCLMREFFSAIPKSIYDTALRGVETEEIRKVLDNSDDRHTIEVFLRCNLNINAASKELFMHRNTLIYRLEKIRNSTGLDLKKFCDAFVFHILMFKK